MHSRKTIKISFGDLVVVVTDEVRRFIQDPVGVNLVVSSIVSDVLADGDVWVRERLRRNMALSPDD
jgi:hypothetical protein